MKCPLCKKSVRIVSPYDIGADVVEACITCAMEGKLQPTTKAKYKKDYATGARYPVWKADIPAIKE